MIQPAPPRPPAPSAFFQDGADSQARAMARRGRTQRVLACLDESVSGRSVAKHALAMGRSLALPITLARIMDVPHWPGMPTDPVEWRLRRVIRRSSSGWRRATGTPARWRASC